MHRCKFASYTKDLAVTPAFVLVQVRVAIAAHLHDMAKWVAPSDAARLLRRPLSALLRDTSPPVREALLGGLAETLQVSRVCWLLPCTCSMRLMSSVTAFRIGC